MMVSIDSMNTQINVRLPEKMIGSAKSYAKKNGFGSVQELIKESLREKIFDKISSKEIKLVKSLIALSEKKNLYGSEKELFNKLKN
jgi:hypothetical protein